MPTDLVLDPTTNDLDISSGSLELFTDNLSVVAQRVKVAILIRQGEWFRNITEGVPYYQEFFTRKNNKPFIDQFMISYISRVEDVNRVVFYESSIDIARRILNISVGVETSDGQVVEINVGELQ